MCRASFELRSKTRLESHHDVRGFDRNVGEVLERDNPVESSAVPQCASAVTSYIGLLRAVNLPGHNKIGMATLRELASALGLMEVQTLLQSGNIVFRSEARGSSQLEQLLEREAAKRIGLTTDFFVRSGSEWQSIIAANPFPKEAKSDPSHLLAFVVKDDVGPKQVKALQEAISGREVVRAKGRCAYLVYPDGIGRSRVTSAVIEKKLGTRGTARNWNTVLKLAALADGAE